MESFRDRIVQLSPQRLTLLAMELQDRVTALEGATHEPIAVVAMACRFPGDSETPAAFWRNLKNNHDCVSAIPGKRWQLAGIKTSDRVESAATWGALLPSIDLFDPAFFHISPSEAAAMDPQQRILLEVCWEAIENAGIAAESLKDSETGVFIGMSSNDYAMLANSQPQDGLNKYVVTGVANSIAVGRVSYLLGLLGPNMAIDTSCSSSATSIHLAVQSLRRRECDLALAGGVHLAVTPKTNASLSRFNLLAADGRCKAFSDSADGLGRGEGCGVLVLKRLEDARRDQDNIVGVIRGTACNQDGRTSGLTAPNGLAQERVVKAALKDAGLSASDIDYVEAHGTGTALGDPIEIAALGRVFAAEGSGSRKVAIGSVKSNIGHLEAAAGVAGVIKVLLTLDQQEIPASLHCATLNRRVPWDELPITVSRENITWKRGKRRRTAGVSSFGYSGTNVHIVIEEAPLRVDSAPAMGSVELVTASAKSDDALKRLCERYARYLNDHPNISITDFARSVNEGRNHFRHRFASVVSSPEDARTAYAAFASAGSDITGKDTFASEDRMSAGNVVGDRSQILQAAAEQYLAGAAMDWKALPGRQPGPKLVLPNYPFERQSYWLFPQKAVSTKAAASPSDAAQTKTYPEVASWLYEIAWEPLEGSEASAVTSAPAAPMEVVEQIMASMAPVLQEAALSIDCSFLPQFRKDADVLSIEFIMQALEQNRLTLAPGKRIAVDVCGLLGISRRYERLMERIFGILEEERIVQKAGPDWLVERVPERIDTRSEIRRMRDAYPLAEAHLAVFERASLLGRVLQGRMNGLEILFPGGSMALAEQLYQQTIHARTMNPLIGRLALAAVESLPANRTLRVLELGAGTGSTTACVVSLLPADRVEYFFTDVSKHFLAGAAKKFSHYSFMRYALHDIERLAALDGEQAGSFDLVIAANVLHATKSLRQTLANVKNLLAPGGFLLLLEASHTERLADITLGTIEGWWRFEDEDLRQRSALIAPALWQELLLELGFRSALLPSEQNLFGVTDDEPAILARLEPLVESSVAGNAVANREEARRFVLVSPMNGHAEAMAAQLRRLGASVIHAVPGDRYQRISDSVVTLSVQHVNDWSRLSEENFSHGAGPQVIYLAGFSPAADAHASEAQRIASEAVGLLQGVLRGRGFSRTLWFVTNGSQPVRSSDAHLATSVLAGLVRVAASEFPDWNCHSIDADPEGQDGSVALLAQTILSRRVDEETELALRDSRIFVPRLRALSPTHIDLRKENCNSTGAWLITGGFGVLGLHVARWLADIEQGDIVLFGRNAPSGTTVEQIEHLRQFGARVTIVVGDVAEEVDVRRLFEQIAREQKPLRGIFHAAAVLEDTSALQLSDESLRRVLAPKVAGSWLLHKYSSGIELKYFVLFSSAASVLGTPGQLNYAMANAFLDGLAHYRQAHGLPGVSIDWGPWTESGADVKRNFLSDWRVHGGESITPSQGLEVLDRMMRSRSSQVVVLPIEWRLFRARSSRRRIPAVLRDLILSEVEHPTATVNPAFTLKEQLDQSSQSERLHILASYVELRLAELLGLGAGASIPQTTPFINLGLDSLMSLELKNEIQNALQMELSTSIFFDYPSLGELLGYFEVLLQADILQDRHGVEEGYHRFRV